MRPDIEIGHRTTGGNVAHISTVPQFGLGVFKMRGMECTKACLKALEAGYRHIDTARSYENEKVVGNALRQSGIPREEIFVTTKLRRGQATGKKDAQTRCQESLEYLGLDYIDLYLIHAPRESIYIARRVGWVCKTA